ncbi:MAG: hypothetical protein Ta2B_09050 [Termitinemataceae bacterium]|nr:MAG: hypothetical protein Ta2B_09050 [Termitinemataceae bacterium]
MKNTDYKQKALEACAIAFGNSMINFKKLKKTGELDITSIEDQWSELIIKMKLVIAEYYNDLTADVDEKEIIVKKIRNRILI